jgi:2,3-bisphosphoglycerate-dependent phosphoglycerate mutase
MTRILLARHGETDWNREGRWQGHSDQPLNATGRAQADALARRLRGEPVSALYTSDLLRASQTAAAVGRETGLDPVPTPGLREVDVGELAGLDRAEAGRRHPDWYTRWREGTDEAYPGGERFSDLRDRALASLDRIADRHAGETAVAVCHNGIVRAVVLHVLGMDPRERRRVAPGPNCSLTIVERQRRRLVLVALNDSGHLNGVGEITLPRRRGR